MFFRGFFLLFYVIFLNFSVFASYVGEEDLTVHIWRPTSSGLPWGNYGHVSLETEDYYISFWPYEKKQVFGSVTSAVVTSYDEDVKQEEKNQDNYFTLKANSQINKKFENFLDWNDIKWNTEKGIIKASSSQWSWSGSYVRDGSFYKTPQSCTTFSLNLLCSSVSNFYYPTMPVPHVGSKPREQVRVPEFEQCVDSYVNRTECNIF